MTSSSRSFDFSGKGVARDNQSLMEMALRAFSQIARAWSLTDAEQSAILGKSPASAIPVYGSDGTGNISHETLERVSYVLGIYSAVSTIFPDQQQADGWVRRPNSAALFSGRPALALMCSGRTADLKAVREYLEAQGIAAPHE